MHFTGPLRMVSILIVGYTIAEAMIGCAGQAANCCCLTSTAMIGHLKRELSTAFERVFPMELSLGLGNCRGTAEIGYLVFKRSNSSDLRYLSPFWIMLWGLLVDAIGDGLQDGNKMGRWWLTVLMQCGAGGPWGNFR